MKRALMIITSLVVFGTAPSCDDPRNVAGPKPPAPVFLPLTNPDAVLNNLQAAYNQRMLNRLDELLDANFTFYLAPGDVGGNVPGQWPRVDELLQTGRMFDPNLNDPSFPRCKSIVMDIMFEDGVEWTAVPGSAGPVSLQETRLAATVFYNFRIQIEPDFTYISIPGARAKFTVRNAGTDGAPRWQLVEWEDMGGGLLESPATTASTEESTWGGVKALYR